MFLAPPTSLNVRDAMDQRKRRTLVAPDMNLSLDRSEGSVLSDDFLETPDDLDINVDDIETPDDTDSLEFMNNGTELEWEGQKSSFGNFWMKLRCFKAKRQIFVKLLVLTPDSHHCPLAYCCQFDILI